MLRSVLVLVSIAAILAPGAASRPERSAHWCVDRNELWFRAADRTRLVGHRFGRGTKAVILAHQSDGDLCEWVPYARRLAAKGYFVFPIDFRGYGFSRGRRNSARFPADVAAATKALRRLGKRKVVLVGSSMGGIASLIAATQIRPQVDGVVSLSAPSQYERLDAVPFMRRLRVPVLYLVARNDRDGRFARDAQALFGATASRDKRLELLDGEEHGIALLDASAQARALLEGFLRG